MSKRSHSLAALRPSLKAQTPGMLVPLFLVLSFDVAARGGGFDVEGLLRAKLSLE